MDSSTQLKLLVDIAWRRKWRVVVPTLLAAAASGILLGMTPKVYRAVTTILVTRQVVPEDVVRSTVTLRIEERMKSLPVQIFVLGVVLNDVAFTVVDRYYYRYDDYEPGGYAYARKQDNSA